MAKNAVVWTTSISYMPGTNAILNALEYYHFSGIDSYVLLWDDLPPDYLTQWPNVHFEKIVSIPDKDAYWHMVFCHAKRAIELLSTYDVILLWGADVCIVNNFSDYFDICSKLDRIIVGHNEQGMSTFDGLSKEWPYVHTWDVPYADIPVFVPRSHRNVLELTLAYQSRPDCRIDWMDGLNYAIRDLSTPVFVVPSTLWVLNVTQFARVLGGATLGELYFSNQRMNSFHRKYWNSQICRTYGSGISNSISAHNHLLFNRTWNFFNRSCRVPWTDNLEVWDGT